MKNSDDLATEPRPAPGPGPVTAAEPAAMLTRKSMDASRALAYAALGAATTVVPLPWVPDAVLTRLRGTLVHDLAACNGLVLTEDARKVLGEPWSSALPRTFLAQTARFAAARLLSRLGPLGWLSPMRVGISTFILGHLFQRYMETARNERAVRIDASEALFVRKAMDKAVLLVFTQEASSPWRSIPQPPEDLRDSRTQFFDGIVLSAASLPGWVVERLESAFDEALSSQPR